MPAAVAFYRRLGLSVDLVAPDHAEIHVPDGPIFNLDAGDSLARWDSGWRDDGGGANAVLGFSLASREAVDLMYGDLVAAGHRGHQPPYDAFWGARYAIVDDPSGNPIGFMSPPEPDRRVWPPVPPPSA